MDYKALYEQSQEDKELANMLHRGCMRESADLLEQIQELLKERTGLREWVDRNQDEIDRLRLVIETDEEERIIPNSFTHEHIEKMTGESWSQEKFEALKEWSEENLCEDASDAMLEGIGYFEEAYDDPDDWETMYGGSWDGTKYTVIMAGGSIDAWQYEIYPRHMNNPTIMKVYPYQNRQRQVNGCRLVVNLEEREDQVKLVGVNSTDKDGEENFYDWLNDCGMLS